MPFTSPSHSSNPHRGAHRRLEPPLESPGQLAVIAVVTWLVGAVIHPLAILAPLGLVLLVLAGAAYLLRPKRRTMYWRGREITLDDDRGPIEQVYDMVFKR